MHIPHGILKLIGLNPTGDLAGLTCYTSRRAGTVWFLKSPPLTPPSEWQRRQRNRFRLAAQAWKDLDHETRKQWALACRRAHLIVSGYNLFLWWNLRRKREQLRTIERQSGITLVP